MIFQFFVYFYDFIYFQFFSTILIRNHIYICTVFQDEYDILDFSKPKGYLTAIE